MADKPVIHIGENSPEEVAYKLLNNIADVEGKSLVLNPTGKRDTADREWILDTYAECIDAVLARRDFTK